MSEIEIDLNGKTETLRCTLRAAKQVNNSGGYAEVLRRLGVFDLNAYVLVVAAGLNKKPADVEESVYQAGLTNLTEALSEYVMMLANGGRLTAPVGDPAEGEA